MKKTRFILSVLLILVVYGCKHSTQVSEHRVVVDIQARGEPISRYIYGQFIEHLGRCIYGGIWSEMLEDRKFYYPVTDEYQPWGTKKDEYWKAGEFPILVASPWERIGPEGCVKMDKSEPFVGEHTPLITVNNRMESGIRQEGLVIQSGMEYTGRIYLSANSPDIKVQVRISNGDSYSKTIEIYDQMKNDFTRYSFQYRMDEDIENASIEIVGTGNGTFRIGSVSLMPANNIDGFNRQVIEYLKDLNSPIYRWPGGNFVSGYDWTDGIGDRDRRPPRKNPAWTGIEHNDVGIHEYMRLCELIDAEPFIAVNTGLGTVDEVAEEVAYCNGPPDSQMGQLRAKNGHPEPFRVKYWAVGNEMYGDWQLGHMPLEKYVVKHNKMAEAMWKVDPDIQLVGVGHVGEWSEAMLKNCKDHMNLISEHIYCQEEEDVIRHVRQIPDNIRRVAEAHREYRENITDLKQKDIRIAMDEWNYWYGDYVYGELGCIYHLKDALGIAAGFHEYFRNSDLYFMANYAQTVNVIGAIKTTKKDVEYATTGLALKLYRNHFETIPVKVSDVPDKLDISASIDDAGEYLTLAVVNPASTPSDFSLNLRTGTIQNIENVWEISGVDPMDFNEPGKSRKIDIIEKSWEDTTYFEVRPYSVTLFRMRIIPEM